MDSSFDSQFLVIKGKRTTWYRPTKLDNLLFLKSKYPEARIVIGNTEVGKFPLCVLMIRNTLLFSLIFQCFSIEIMRL
jgi:xanthine dehydrogenase iron-sulfur cluster and FAD-binding subunit A